MKFARFAIPSGLLTDFEVCFIKAESACIVDWYKTV